MPTDTASSIAYVGAFVGLIGGGVALFNSWKAVCWKRAELANTDYVARAGAGVIDDLAQCRKSPTISERSAKDWGRMDFRNQVNRRITPRISEPRDRNPSNPS